MKNIIKIILLSLCLISCSYVPDCDDEDVVDLLKKIYREEGIKFIALNKTKELNSNANSGIRMCTASLVYQDRNKNKDVDFISYEIKYTDHNNMVSVEIFDSMKFSNDKIDKEINELMRKGNEIWKNY